MRRLGFAAAALLLAACRATASAEPSVADTPHGSATFEVTGSGFVCGPWWFGCGAILTVTSPDSKAPADWSPGPGDTWFQLAADAGSEGPRPVTGVMPDGRHVIDPGRYRLVVVLTQQGDTSDATMTPSFGCARDLDVAPATAVVSVDVKLGVDPPACLISVSLR